MYDNYHIVWLQSQACFHETISLSSVGKIVVIYHVCLSLRKSPCSSPFAFFNYTVTPDVTRHHTPPCFEGVRPLSEGDVLAPCQHRDGSIHPGTGALHCLYSGKSRGFGRVLSPYIGRALGELWA